MMKFLIRTPFFALRTENKNKMMMMMWCALIVLSSSLLLSVSVFFNCRFVVLVFSLSSLRFNSCYCCCQFNCNRDWRWRRNRTEKTMLHTHTHRHTFKWQRTAHVGNCNCWHTHKHTMRKARRERELEKERTRRINVNDMLLPLPLLLQRLLLLRLCCVVFFLFGSVSHSFVQSREHAYTLIPHSLAAKCNFFAEKRDYLELIAHTTLVSYFNSSVDINIIVFMYARYYYFLCRCRFSRFIFLLPPILQRNYY